MRIRSALLLAAVAVAVAPIAGQASHPNAPTATSTGCQYSKVTTIGTGAANSQTIYIDDRPAGAPVPGILGGGGTWGYMESNGKARLQVGGPHQTLMLLLEDEETVKSLGELDPCDNFHDGASDQMIF